VQAASPTPTGCAAIASCTRLRGSRGSGATTRCWGFFASSRRGTSRRFGGRCGHGAHFNRHAAGWSPPRFGIDRHLPRGPAVGRGRKGYNLRRKDRDRHRPIVAVLAEALFVSRGWRRSAKRQLQLRPWRCGVRGVSQGSLGPRAGEVEGYGAGGRTAGSWPTTSRRCWSRARC